MHPEICTIGPITIYSYGVMLVIAFLTASFLAGRRAHELSVKPEIVYNLTFYALLGGIAGARIFFVLEHVGFYLSRPIEIIRLQEGGLSWFGGLFGGILVALFYLWKQRIAFLYAADFLAPYIALAHALGRIGCFLNGCCGGRESAFGIYFPVHDKVLIPTQLYSSFMLTVIFIILRIMQQRSHKQGEIFFVYLGIYAAWRFFIEFWRTEHPDILAGLTLFQLISIGIVICVIIGLIKGRRK